MKVVLIVAGTSDPSNSNVLASTFMDGMKEESDIKLHQFRLRDLHIEQFSVAKHYDHAAEHQDDYGPIEVAIRDAHAVIIASPIWNFSVPGHLKNFIDRLGALGLDAETHSRGTFCGKPFYLLYTTGAPTQAWPAMFVRTTSHMPESLRYYGASVIGTFHEGRCTAGRGIFGLVIDKRPDVLRAAKEKGKRFALIVDRFAKTGQLPFAHQLWFHMRQFTYAMMNKIVYAFKK